MVGSTVVVVTRRPQLELQQLYVTYTEAEIKWRRIGYETGPGVTLVWWRENSSRGSSQSSSRPTAETAVLTGLFPGSSYTIQIREELFDYTVESILEIKTKELIFRPILSNISASSIEIEMDFEQNNENLNLFTHYLFTRGLGSSLTGKLQVVDAKNDRFILENLVPNNLYHLKIEGMLDVTSDSLGWKIRILRNDTNFEKNIQVATVSSGNIFFPNKVPLRCKLSF